MAPKGRGEGFCRAEEGGDAGAHFAEGVEDAVEDDEEGEDALDGGEGAAEDEADKRPEGEAEAHGLFAADAVHEEAADKAAWEVELVSLGWSSPS